MDNWFDELAENSGVDPKDLNKDYIQILPLKLGKLINKNTLSNIIDMIDFHDIDFYPNKKPNINYKGNKIYILDKECIVIIKKDNLYMCVFHIYEMNNVYIRRGELIMTGWDYNINYDFSTNQYEEINNR